MTDKQAQRQQEAYIQQVAEAQGSTSAADGIAKATALLDAGTITRRVRHPEGQSLA